MFRVVTTMNRAGWKQTGARMIESFRRMWPDDVELLVYAEGFTLPEQLGVTVKALPEWQTKFKWRHKEHKTANGQLSTRYDFRFDAVKFSHKVGAVVDAGLDQTDGVLIWLDADTYTHAPVDKDWLTELFPEPSYIAWLDRLNHYPECGFVMYRCGHRSHRLAMEAWRDLYVSDQVLRLTQTHDCMSLQSIIDGMVRSGDIEKPVSLSGSQKGWSHPMVAGPLGSRLDHCKGQERKRNGRSNKWDTRGVRSEPYWQMKERD